MILGLAITIAVLIPLGVMCWLVATAPLGYEDSDGFHLGEPDEHAEPENWGV